MQNPSIGRIVHYKNELGDIYPAIITCLGADGALELTVFGVRAEQYHTATSMAAGPRDAQPGQWWWPERV